MVNAGFGRSRLKNEDYKFLRLLRFGPFVRHWRVPAWRFGTRKITSAAIGRLVAAGLARIEGDRVVLIEQEAAQ